jgi:hypothetical protein
LNARTRSTEILVPKQEYKDPKSSVFCCPLDVELEARQLPGIPYAVEDETVTEQLGDVRADDDRWLPLGDSTEGLGFRCSLADDDSCAGVLLTQDRSKKRPKPDGFGGRGDGGVGERLAAGIS